MNEADHDVCIDRGDDDGVVLYDPVEVAESGDESSEEEPLSRSELASTSQTGARVTQPPTPLPTPALDSTQPKRRSRANRKRSRGVGVDPPPLTADEERERAEARAAARQRHRQSKKRKRKAKTGVPPTRRLLFLQRGLEATGDAKFSTTDAMHASTGYIGLDDKRRDYNIIGGTAEEIFERLTSFGYELLDVEGK